MTRFEANKELLKILESIIDKNPDLRFSQILVGFEFVSGAPSEVFYKESEALLKSVRDKVSAIEDSGQAVS